MGARVSGAGSWAQSCGARVEAGGGAFRRDIGERDDAARGALSRASRAPRSMDRRSSNSTTPTASRPTSRRTSLASADSPSTRWDSTLRWRSSASAPRTRASLVLICGVARRSTRARCSRVMTPSRRKGISCAVEGWRACRFAQCGRRRRGFSRPHAILCGVGRAGWRRGDPHWPGCRQRRQGREGGEGSVVFDVDAAGCGCRELHRAGHAEAWRCAPRISDA